MWNYEKEQFTAVLRLLTALQAKDDLALSHARERVRRAHEIKRERDQKLGNLPARDSAFEQCLIPPFDLKPGQESEAIEQ